MDYRIYDNLGNSTIFTLASNANSGQAQVGFSSAGNVIYLQSLSQSVAGWDFFIDNIRFSAPVEPVPEPSTMLLLGSGLAGLAGWKLRKKTKR